MSSNRSLFRRLFVAVTLSWFTISVDVQAQRQMGEQFDDITEASVAYVTLRARTGKSKPSKFYGGSRGTLEKGFCRMKRSTRKSLKRIADKSRVKIPTEKIEITDITLLDEAKFQEYLDNAAQKGSINLYIHGYNVGFSKACGRAGLFQRALGLDGQLLLFSWPADGDVLNYTRDEADLAWSVDYIVSFIQQLSANNPNTQINLVGHSLGTRGLVNALAYSPVPGTGSKPFNQIILLAADVDTDRFIQLLPKIQSQVNRITVYASEGDKALQLSNKVHGYPRLGEAGPYLTLNNGMDTVDVSGLDPGSSSGHTYHHHNLQVQNDIRLILSEELSADARPGLRKKKVNGIPAWDLLLEH